MEVTLEITNFCEENCDYCSSNATNLGKHLEVLDITKFLANIDKPINRINISGGEPLAHPNFYNILKICEEFCKDVRVYTNALKHILYNTSVVKEIKIEANVCLVPGRESYIPENADKINLLKLVPQGRASNFKSKNIKLSGSNCKECNHLLLQADGQVVDAPCKKKY